MHCGPNVLFEELDFTLFEPLHPVTRISYNNVFESVQTSMSEGRPRAVSVSGGKDPGATAPPAAQLSTCHLCRREKGG